MFSVDQTSSTHENYTLAMNEFLFFWSEKELLVSFRVTA